MAIYKIKGQLNVVFDNLEIDADSEEGALNKFYRMDTDEIIRNCYIDTSDSTDEEAELIEGTFNVHVNSINYDVSFNDCWDIVVDEHPGIDEDSDEFDQLVYAKMAEIKSSLPQEFDFEIDCEKENLDDYVAERIEDETNWLIHYCDYKIVSVK